MVVKMSDVSLRNLEKNKNLLTTEPRKMVWCAGALVFLVTVLVYTPVLQNGFVNWDDTLYIVDNEHIRSLNLESLYWMCTTFHAGFWFPITWFSHTLDYALWGLNPAMHHFTSIVLHGLNALLVFFVACALFSRAKTAHTGLQHPHATKIPFLQKQHSRHRSYQRILLHSKTGSHMIVRR